MPSWWAPGPPPVQGEEVVVGRKGDGFGGSRRFFKSSFLDSLSITLPQPTSYLSSALLFLLWFPFRCLCFPVFCHCATLCPAQIWHQNPGLQPLSTHSWLSGLFSHGQSADNSHLACPTHSSLASFSQTWAASPCTYYESSKRQSIQTLKCTDWQYAEIPHCSLVFNSHCVSIIIVLWF